MKSDEIEGKEKESLRDRKRETREGGECVKFVREGAKQKEREPEEILII